MTTKTIEKISLICNPIIGKTIDRFETAELLLEEEWDDWHDLPIRIYFTDQSLISIAWSHFDELWLSNDLSLPFKIDGQNTRWKTNGISSISDCIGSTIERVSLGRGAMQIEGKDVEIWTRLIFDLGGKWLEIFNALDENGYTMHAEEPEGELRYCT